MRADVRALTAYNLADVDVAFNVRQRPLARALLHTVAWWPAHRLAHTLADADAHAAAHGMPAAGALLVERIAGASEAIGTAAIPATGPLLCVSNHPGLVDAPALCAVIGRRDLRIIAAERALLRALPGIRTHLIEVPESGPARSRALREAARHLRDGGALLSFPAGRIEPDPAVMPDAAESLSTWSDMPVALRRMVPAVHVIACCVSGVCSAAALAHPWVQRRGTRRDREWLAATLQLMLPWYRARTVRVRAAAIAPEQSVTAVMAALIRAERQARGLPISEEPTI